MQEIGQEEAVLRFNLGHELMLTFWADMSCTIEPFEVGAGPLRLTKEQQLLLLDAFCRQYSFPSPVERLVNAAVVGEQPDVDDDEGASYYNAPHPDDLPRLT